MITISDGKLTIPEGQRFIGFTGDNRHTQKTFFIRNTPESGWLYRLYLTFDDGRHNFFVLPATVSDEGTILTWNIEESHILKSGLVKAQIKAFSESNEVYHTTSDIFVAGKSTEEDEEFKNSNSEFLLYEKTLNDLYLKMKKASAKMPFVGENGHWYTYNAVTEVYEDSGISTSVNIGNGTVTPQNLDRAYWQKYECINVTGYDYFNYILREESAACAIYRVEFSGLSPVRNQVGEGSFIAFVSYNCDNLLLLNISTGESWIFRKGADTLESIKIDGTNLKEGAVSDDKLALDYLRRIERVSMATYADFDAILGEESSYASIYRLDFSGISPLIPVVGYGSFIAFADRQSETLLIINIQNGQRWTYTKGSQVLEKAEPVFDCISIKGINALSELKSYPFEYDRIYSFCTNAEIQSTFGSGLCVACISKYDNSKLWVHNLTTKENFEYNLTDSTVRFLNGIVKMGQSSDVRTLANKEQYRYVNALKELDIRIVESIEEDFECSVTFASGVTPTVFSCPSSVKWSGDDVASVTKTEDNNEIKFNCLVPQKNKVYNIIFWYDGMYLNAASRGVESV